MKKGDTVKLIQLDERNIDRVKIGSIGVIIATRPFIDNQTFVKFKGKAGHVSIEKRHLQLTKGE